MAEPQNTLSILIYHFICSDQLLAGISHFDIRSDDCIASTIQNIPDVMIRSDTQMEKQNDMLICEMEDNLVKCVCG